MDPRIDLIHQQTEREFRGHTFNGKSLIETCRALTAEQAFDSNTYEGFTAWDNLAHCVYFKFVLLRYLGGAVSVEPYPWKEGSFPPAPAATPESWAHSLDYAEAVHNAYQNTLETFDGNRLTETFAPWECTLGDGLVWVATHDTYHTAQIRNMGLEAFRKPRKPAAGV
jgi:uncharacterized damage-inducible protein DinB